MTQNRSYLRESAAVVEMSNGGLCSGSRSLRTMFSHKGRETDLPPFGSGGRPSKPLMPLPRLPLFQSFNTSSVQNSDYFLLFQLLLSQNHCADAFWLGNLKNRDLAGQEIHDTDVSTRHSGRTTLSTASPLSSRGGDSKNGSYTIEGAEELMSEEDSEVGEVDSSDDDAGEEEEDEN